MVLPSALTGRWIRLTDAPPKLPTLVRLMPYFFSHSTPSADSSASSSTSSGLLMPLPPIMVSSSISSSLSK